MKGGGKGINVDRKEDDRIEFMSNNSVEKLMMKKWIIEEIEYGKLKIEVIEWRVIIKGLRKKMNEIRIK